MRRSLAVVGASIVALLCITPSAWAAESISSGSWSGSALDAGPTTVAVGSYRLSGTFRHQLNRAAQVTVSASPAGEGACAIAPVVGPASPSPQVFNVTLTVPCNGTYTVLASAVTSDNNAFFPRESATLDRRVVVAAPAPKVTGVAATADGRSVAVTWDDMTDAAPDLTGYVIERKIDDGSFEQLATAGGDQHTYADAALPAKGGDATYRVYATRPSPNGDKVSAASDEAATPFVAAPQDTTTTTASGDSTGSTGAAGGSDGSGATGSGEQATSASSSSGGSRARVSAPSVFSGTFLPPLLRPAAQTISMTTTTTEDTGFNEALPYERGQAKAVLPKNAMASIVTDSRTGRGMAIPIATALVLAVWALHLRMLARAARPLD